MNIKNFIAELKRRNVIKVATAYAIAGWLIIQIATSVFPAFAFPEWTTQFVIIVIAIGLPLSLIFAWAFELTPEGIKKSKEVDITQSVTDRTGKKLNGIIISVLSIALFFVVIERIFFAKASILEDAEVTAQIETASIAVLPFVNMSGDMENEYFSDGLSEELLNGLAKLEDLQVAGRTSSFQFKGTNPDLRDVGSKLGVKHILEGSVRKSGNRIRITAQLIQADNGFHLWSETYDRELTANDIFDIQEEITRKVITELKVKLLPQENIALSEQPTEDIEAYNAFLEATQIETSRRPEDIASAIAKYKEAVRIDPTFSLAYARLAYSYVLLHDYGNASFEETKELIRENIDQALLINSNEGKAYQALSAYFTDFESDFSKSLDAAKKAVELLPNDAMAHNALTNAYFWSDQEDKRNESAKKAYQLDPLNNVIAGNYSGYLVRKEEFEAALELLDEIMERSPEYKNAFARKSAILADPPYGQIGESFKLIYQAYKLDPENRELLFTVGDRAKELDFFTLSEYMTKELERLYPENTTTLDRRFSLNLMSGEFEKAEAIALQLKENYGGERTIFYFRALNYTQGKYKEALAPIEEFEPELMQNPPVLNPSNEGWAGTTVVLFRELGRNEEADLLAEKYCEYLENKEVGEGLRLDEKFNKFSCLLVSNNTDETIELIEDLYFNENWKRRWPEGLVFNTIPTDLKKSEEFKNIVKKVYADLHAQRANVIEYLKAEGEWKEEWEVRN
tara:strand:+ start:11390 stop:13612 length:2223 start_codon:yes stop_codon:yes gene_type:complete